MLRKEDYPFQPLICQAIVNNIFLLFEITIWNGQIHCLQLLRRPLYVYLGFIPIITTYIHILNAWVLLLFRSRPEKTTTRRWWYLYARYNLTATPNFNRQMSPSVTVTASERKLRKHSDSHFPSFIRIWWTTDDLKRNSHKPCVCLTAQK